MTGFGFAQFGAGALCALAFLFWPAGTGRPVSVRVPPATTAALAAAGR